jgi:hypothetical protein
MSTLRIIIRFLIIAIAIGLLVFLSISLFRLIPAGINQLASATVSLGQRTSLTKEPVATSTTQANPTPAPVTEDGLNGLYDTEGDIVILDERTENNSSDTNTNVKNVVPKTTAAAKRYYTTYTSNTYVPNQYVLSGRKNLNITFTSIGVFRNGQYVQTNAFQTTDSVSMKFTIINNEDTPTGTWGMRVEMPAALGGDKVKVLNNLASIQGKSAYTGEVRFDGIDLSQGTPVIRIYLDIYNEVAESNEGDNTLAIEMRNVINNNYYNNNYYNYNNYGYGSDINYTHNCFNGTYYYNCNDTSWYNNGNNGNNNTQPNLYIPSIELGRLVNGSFVAQTTFTYGDIIVVRARVRNSGGYMNNSWSTRLNIFDTNNYSRDISTGSQSPLSSNGETTVTYELTNLTRGNNRLIFYVDSQNNISESNEGDNSIERNIQVY